MVPFENLFGTPSKDIRKTAVLLPVIYKGMLEQFNIKKLNRGNVYSSASNENLTLIHTNISAPLTGDAVLYLKETPVKNLILLGSCGLVKINYKNTANDTLHTGDVVMPKQSFALESFSSLLAKQYDNALIEAKADHNLIAQLQSLSSRIIPTVICATMGSLALEPQYINFFDKNRVQIVDMECSAFFQAAESVNLPAAAIFFISDIISESSAGPLLPSLPFPKIQVGVQDAVSLIHAFAMQSKA